MRGARRWSGWRGRSSSWAFGGGSAKLEEEMEKGSEGKREVEKIKFQLSSFHLRRFAEGAAATVLLLVLAAPPVAGLLTAFLFRVVVVVFAFDAGGCC